MNDELRFFRGVVTALLLSAAFWGVLAVAYAIGVSR